MQSLSHVLRTESLTGRRSVIGAGVASVCSSLAASPPSVFINLTTAIHFISRLLDTNPATRMTLAAALIHPWLTNKTLDDFPKLPHMPQDVFTGEGGPGLSQSHPRLRRRSEV